MEPRIRLRTLRFSLSPSAPPAALSLSQVNKSKKISKPNKLLGIGRINPNHNYRFVK